MHFAFGITGPIRPRNVQEKNASQSNNNDSKISPEARIFKATDISNKYCHKSP